MSFSSKIVTHKRLKPFVFSSLMVLASLAHADKPPFPSASLPEQAQGQRAIQLLANRLPAVAAWYGMSTAEFARTLREDKAAWIDQTGRLLYIEDEVAITADEVIAPQASIPYSETFALHSKAGSNRVIYLDFTGFVTSGTAWASGATIDSPPFSLDTDATSFNNSEMDIIQEVWKRVAEDYAPFDVDVTTEDPGQAAITRSSSTDQNYGTRALITTQDSRLCGGCGGVAYVGVYDIVGDYYQPAFVFYDALGSAKNMAEAVSHEIGHNLGLNHDGTSTTGYYTGHGSGETSWSPIMGVGYYTQLSQWSKGEYNDANQSQDDMVVMQQNGVLLKTDDHLDAFNASATALQTIASTTQGMVDVSGTGVITTQADQDVFSLDIGEGDIVLNVNPATVGTNLDIEASLYDSSGNLLIVANPIDTTAASISLQGQAAGTYYLKIDGVGKDDALAYGYTDYGSLGQYVISGSVPESLNLSAPVAVITPITAQGNAPLAVSFDASRSYDNDGNILNYHWDFGDGSSNDSLSNTSHTFNAPGAYTVTLSVTDNDGLMGTASTVVDVANQVPVAAASATLLSGIAPFSTDFSSVGSFDPDTAHTLSYAWDFGDGDTSTSANPSHLYSTAGDFIATLTVTDDLGASASDAVNISITADQNTAPAAPSALTTTFNVSGKGKARTRTLVLNWVDNSTNEDGFIIESCQENGKGKSKTCDYSDLTSLSADTISYTPVTRKGTFKYKVRAVNSFGFGRSNEVKVRIK